VYRIIAAVILALSVVAFGVAQAVPPGYDAASFARVGMGVRAQAMGGAFCAIAQGPTGGYWNPAGLACLQGFQAEGMYTDWLGAGIDLQYISLAGYPSIGEKRPTLSLEGRPVKFAASWVSVRVADIPMAPSIPGPILLLAPVLGSSPRIPPPRLERTSSSTTTRFLRGRASGWAGT